VYLRALRAETDRTTTIHGAVLLVVMVLMLALLFARRDNGPWELGLLVVIRTFLSWGLVVEIEEGWPWQAPRVERTSRAEP
jgi:hypothetical protein